MDNNGVSGKSRTEVAERLQNSSFFNAKFIIFDEMFIIFDEKFIILNKKNVHHLQCKF